MTESLFAALDPAKEHSMPLAARMRPCSLDDFVGQTHLLGPGKPLRESLKQGHMHSLLLWGPAGVGKTTLVQLIAREVDAQLEQLSAVCSGVKDIRQIANKAEQLHQKGQRIIVFVDEVHRFNKAQQDAFLPHIEAGTFIFMGATTENPSFEINTALLSRIKVYRLKPLDGVALTGILQRALKKDVSLNKKSLTLSDAAQTHIIQAADGDARRLLNTLEICADALPAGATITSEMVRTVLLDQPSGFDKRGDHFYDQLSAFHKSVRGSSAEGALYWFARMLIGGADPLVVARRLLAIASEDIGNADPRALPLCVAAWDTFTRLGGEDGTRAIAQAAVYCACAPKSNALYRAWNAMRQTAKDSDSLPVPLHLRNAPTALMAEQGNGQGYRYAHNEPNAYAAGECYFPDEMAPISHYHPQPRGLEIRIQEKLAQWSQLDKNSAEKRRG